MLPIRYLTQLTRGATAAASLRMKDNHSHGDWIWKKNNVLSIDSFLKHLTNMQIWNFGEKKPALNVNITNSIESFQMDFGGPNIHSSKLPSPVALSRWAGLYIALFQFKPFVLNEKYVFYGHSKGGEYNGHRRKYWFSIKCFLWTWGRAYKKLVSLPFSLAPVRNIGLLFVLLLICRTQVYA